MNVGKLPGYPCGARKRHLEDRQQVEGCSLSRLKLHLSSLSGPPHIGRISVGLQCDYARGPWDHRR